MSARIAWAGEGGASIETLDGDRITVISSRAFAPGSRPEGTLGEGGPRIWVKVHGSRRQDDGSFRVTGRVINATKELRELLKGAVPSQNGGKSPNS